MMRTLTLMLIGVLTTAAWATTAPAPGPQTEADKTVYALGLLLSRNVKSLALTEHEIKLVTAGLADGLKDGKPAVDADAYMPKVQAFAGERTAAAAVKYKEAGKAFRDKAATDKDTQTTASGVVITTLTAGTGAAPTASDQVKVNYEGKLIDGTVFDSSIKRGQPATFGLSGVVPCWTEALQLMKVGGKSRVICPSDAAYGDRGRPPTIPGGATLVFEVELLDIVK
jgi:FKBP-type peptidyl-prolyl cis-trans isomerase